MLTGETYEACVEMARRITEWSNKSRTLASFLSLQRRRPGIMEAANKGARLAKGKSIGLNISLPFEQVANPYITPELNLEFHLFLYTKVLVSLLRQGPGGLFPAVSARSMRSLKF